MDDDRIGAVQARLARHAVERAGLDAARVWWHCFQLGGEAGMLEVDAYLHGCLRLPAAHRDLLARDRHGSWTYQFAVTVDDSDHHLGIGEAEDVVQDAFLHWQAADRQQIQVPEAWLTKVVTNLCLDRLRSAQARRERTVGAWLAVKRHRRTYWKLDDEGFGLRRGNWWQVEVRVPLSRVQHLDLKRGPLERSLNLSTLVVHTAGTKLAAVSASGLDAADAERLRDRLAHQLDRDDAL